MNCDALWILRWTSFPLFALQILGRCFASVQIQFLLEHFPGLHLKGKWCHGFLLNSSFTHLIKDSGLGLSLVWNLNGGEFLGDPVSVVFYFEENNFHVQLLLIKKIKNHVQLFFSSFSVFSCGFGVYDQQSYLNSVKC